jgi:hypothetical protein
MILEGTDHIIHFIYRSAELEAARRQGRLTTNAFVRFTRQLAYERLVTRVQSFGNADALVSNGDYMRNEVRKLLKRGVVPTLTGTAGWLGSYEVKLIRTFEEMSKAHARLRPMDRFSSR